MSEVRLQAFAITKRYLILLSTSEPWYSASHDDGAAQSSVGYDRLHDVTRKSRLSTLRGKRAAVTILLQTHVFLN
jgi:hypothetical protein